MNAEFLKTNSPVFWEGVKLGLMMSAFTQKEKRSNTMSERQAALKFGMTSKEFRDAFVICEDPEIAPITVNIPNRKKVFRKYLIIDVDLLIEKHKNKFDWQGYQRKKKTHIHFD
ncbi:MAG: hypothetical protein RDU14_16860 [Melioribacteraceae bacterium]|nr:hypothetical protein [Melioribacteraceae bacterium]